jgi:hydrogenase expression/formation protein HypE
MSVANGRRSEARFASAAPVCPAPLPDSERVQLGHGSGGKMSARLLRERFLPYFRNDILAQLGDAAVVGVGGEEIALSTDTFVVTPIEFPGGNIGSLAVHGTLNDLAMMGAVPLYLSAGFVLEEGLELGALDRIVRAMAAAADVANVKLVTGDTKVVERGKADGIFINTTGIGMLRPDFRPRPDGAQPGDVIITSGPLGTHGIAIMAAREGLGFTTQLESDSASLHPLVERLRLAIPGSVRVLRDPTRGGAASALNEIAAASRVGIELDEQTIPVPAEVASACEMLGLDPLYVANEGVFLAFVAASAAEGALATLRSHPLGTGAACIGRVVERHSGMVVLRTAIGGTRVVDMLPGDQLPRIC